MTEPAGRRGAGAQGVVGRKTTEIHFHSDEGAHSGTGTGDREWQITACYTGWRLEFRDPGDLASTYAGTHATVAAAMTEANR